jgi:3-oxoacyl-[acyl-carrier-protein] synthase-1
LEALPPEALALPWSQIPVFFCTREDARPGPRRNGVMSGLKLPDGQPFPQARAAHLPLGPIGGFQALQQAQILLNRNEAPACAIVAVDSLIDARALHWLESNMRLKTKAQSDGVIPGEAASITLISPRPMMPTGVQIDGLGFATELATLDNDEPMLGLGLTAALKGALGQAGIAMHDVDFRISDVAGESFAFEEVVLAQTRTLRKVRPSQPLWHAADCIGDVGAAAAAVQFAWAEQGFDRGYAPGATSVLMGSSCFGPRAAAIVSDQNNGREVRHVA